ncbi:CPBP family intramembrane metalloprotease [Planktothrix mougeotii LEGE 06226]|uniref:CPBP family intramembrane metalloprotease n=2 Tax=Microcoleaceae TaxID=1892252 RepID=A0ABR9U6S1_9CYAN|nr:CPBP family intramembrane metalloprotease [Planktothrix sp. FACHB-1365]MBE9142158.1 CPBP family intramembrane metalloprotease [Planktothrix mougeotii LEGE 06226]
MGGTAIVLLAIAKAWLHLSRVTLLPVTFSAISLGWGLGVGLIITIASFILYRIWPAYSRSANIYLKLVLSPLLWPDLIWLGLLPGLSEELLFRGVMLSDLGLTPLALVVSSIAFGVLHFSGSQQWPYVIWAIIVGFLLGYSAIATGNLLVPIIAHVLTNFMSGCLWKLKYIGGKS